MVFPVGGTGHMMMWQLSDNSVLGATFTVYLNGTPSIINQPWTPGVPINVDVTNFAVGSYNFTIIAQDGLGGVVSDEVIVTVKPANSGGGGGGGGGGTGSGGDTTIDGFPFLILCMGIMAGLVMMLSRNLHKMRKD